LFVVTRSAIWPRYLVPLLPIFLYGLVRVYVCTAPQRRNAERLLPGISIAVLAALTVLAVANTHDHFVDIAARMGAVSQLTAAGIPRRAIEAGPELDGWFQVETTGYLNDSRIRVPANAYKPRDFSGVLPGCHYYFLKFTPSIEPRFLLSGAPGGCFPPAQFPSVRYRAWCSPHDRAIYISAIPAKETVAVTAKEVPAQ